nr:immunoglobulin heavy chain junction region [Macaca mulatta]MOW78845.1 immunoglobulin heavy chain junction region [Macaca mulatta]MOW79601.1 immunoglobulin heavy chain junction region [Macaca mulatta]MOW86409.1 immunoglobulin heavy chain junction region [Macaca mulatta]
CARYSGTAAYYFDYW